MMDMLVLFENQFDELVDRLKNVTMELVDDVIDILFVRDIEGSPELGMLDAAAAAYASVAGSILKLNGEEINWLKDETTIRIKLCKELGEHYVEKRGMVVGVFMEFVYLILLEKFVKVRDDSMIEDWKAMMQNMEDDGK